MTIDDARIGQRIVRAGTGPNAGKTGTIVFIFGARINNEQRIRPIDVSVHYDGMPWFLRESLVPLHELEPLEGGR